MSSVLQPFLLIEVRRAFIEAITQLSYCFYVNRLAGIRFYFLSQLASESGGRAFYPVNVDHLHRSFAAIGQELHTSYRIAYTPKNATLDGTWRAIEVRTPGHEDLVIRARQGYYAVPQGSR